MITNLSSADTTETDKQYQNNFIYSTHELHTKGSDVTRPPLTYARNLKRMLELKKKWKTCMTIYLLRHRLGGHSLPHNYLHVATCRLGDDDVNAPANSANEHATRIGKTGIN